MQPSSNAGRLSLRAITVVLLLGALSACSNIEPWVKPYERQ